MTTTEARPQLPFARPNVLETAPLYEVLRREAPLTRVTTAVGDTAWLVTGFEATRELIADRRLGRSHPDPDNAPRISTDAIQGGPMGNHATEAAEHVRLRKMLTPAFSARRMLALTEHVQRLVDDCVDRMEAARAGSPDGVVDLHELLALPVPIAVICKLLGVPESDGELFRGLSDRMASYAGDDPGDSQAAFGEFAQYMTALTDARRTDPGEDVISDLVRAQDADAEFDHGFMIFIAVGLLFAGHETTVNRIGLGTLLLLTRHEHWEALVADPDGRVGDTVEEIMRFGAPGDLGLLRYAHEDVEIGGVTVRRGEAVLLSLNAANRDPGQFPDAGTFDPTREDKVHLGFGHGPHFCIGASLARIELRTVFATLAKRLPGLRLAKDLDAIEVRADHITGGVTELPVTW